MLLGVGLHFGQNCVQIPQKSTQKRFTSNLFVKREKSVRHSQQFVEVPRQPRKAWRGRCPGTGRASQRPPLGEGSAACEELCPQRGRGRAHFLAFSHAIRKAERSALPETNVTRADLLGWASWTTMVKVWLQEVTGTPGAACGDFSLLSCHLLSSLPEGTMSGDQRCHFQFN